MRSSEDPAPPVRASQQERSGYPRARPKAEPTDIDEVTDLLRQLIRNRCVNDGSAASGQEVRSVDTLASYFQSPGVEMKRYEPVPGRGSLLLRIDGTDRTAPTLCLMGHIDVVPASPEGWRHDPFGGELIDGEVWGRGAIDMLGITASMAVATKHIHAGRRPRGTLLYLAVADEEALGTHGAEWLVNNAWDDVRCDMLVTEFGGSALPIGSRRVLPVMTGEKGSHWMALRVRGVPGHGSMPYKTDNAVVTLAEVIRRIARYRPPAVAHAAWLGFVEALGLDARERAALRTPAGIDGALEGMSVGAARMLHGATHTTISPNIATGGVKTNIVPDVAEVTLDIRTLPGVDGDGVRALLADALGDLWPKVEVCGEAEDNPATSSPADTPLYRALVGATERLVPGAQTAPFLIMGATDARFFRRKGVAAYGYGLFGEKIPFDEFTQMFHGRNERIDQGSLRLMVDLWEQSAREVLA